MELSRRPGPFGVGDCDHGWFHLLGGSLCANSYRPKFVPYYYCVLESQSDCFFSEVHIFKNKTVTGVYIATAMKCVVKCPRFVVHDLT